MPFQEYSPEQAALLPAHVRDVLSEKHLVFLISAMVEKQDLRKWESVSRDRVISEAGLRAERARKRRQIRQWERALAPMDSDENPGGMVVEMEQVQQRLAEIPGELQKLRKSGQKKISRTDADSRFLHSREGFMLGFTAEAVVSEDGLIVAARVTQAAHDYASLVPLVEEAEQRCGRRPEKVLADAGFYSNQNVEMMEARGVELYVPDAVLAREIKQGRPVAGAARICHAGLKRMRRRLRSPAGRQLYETTQRPDRTGLRNPERTSRDAEILPSGAAGSERGVLVDGSGLQLDPAARLATQLSTPNRAAQRNRNAQSTETLDPRH
jgi:hypothetical protein